MSWPTTSSITTNCGSFKPLARATRVAAGIPTRTANADSKTAAHGCQVAVIQCVRSHHKSTVSADAQLPGPGRMYPVPKKVPTSVAQSGARDTPKPVEGTAGGTPASVFIGVIRAGGEFIVRRIRQRRGNDISTAGPFPEIDQAAAIAAKGEVGVFACDCFLAGGALQVGALADHRVITRFSRAGRNRGPG